MHCDLCGANGLLLDVPQPYKRDDVNKFCVDCSMDIESACKQLESISKTTRKRIGARAQRVMLAKQGLRTAWTVITGNKNELLARIFKLKETTP